MEEEYEKNVLKLLTEANFIEKVKCNESQYNSNPERQAGYGFDYDGNAYFLYPENVDTEEVSLIAYTKIYKSINVIKGCVIFFTVLTTFSIIIGIVLSLISASAY